MTGSGCGEKGNLDFLLFDDVAGPQGSGTGGESSKPRRTYSRTARKGLARSNRTTDDCSDVRHGLAKAKTGSEEMHRAETESSAAATAGVDKSGAAVSLSFFARAGFRVGLGVGHAIFECAPQFLFPRARCFSSGRFRRWTRWEDRSCGAAEAIARWHRRVRSGAA